MQGKIYSVFEITTQIKQLLESRFLQIEVKGEVTNLKLSSTGHFYFSLKDEKSTLNCIFFKSSQSIEFKTIKNGDVILVKGSLNLYELNGSYQLVVRNFTKAGIGDILIKIHLLKEKYQKLGYFDSAIKKKIPHLPKKIAVVTALTGAVIQDIIQVLERRVHSYHLLIYPVKVQGESTALEIKEAIETINHHKIADVIIIARGGGSFEDLLPFNSPEIVEAIFNSKLPVISAIGHETDHSLCDLVSDIRAATPSIAAELVCMPTLEILSKMTYLHKRIEEKTFNFISKLKKLHLGLKKHFYQKGLESAFDNQKFRLESLNTNLENIFTIKIKLSNQKILRFSSLIEQKNPINEQNRKKELLKKSFKDLDLIIKKSLDQKKSFKENFYLTQLYNRLLFKLKSKKEILNSYKSQLLALNPKSILKKGYCIPYEYNSNNIVHSKDSIDELSSLDLLFHDGKKTINLVHKDLSHEYK